MTTRDRPRTRGRTVRVLLTIALLAVALLYLVDLVGPTTTEAGTFDLGSAATVLHIEVGSGSVLLTSGGGKSLRGQRTVRRGWREPHIVERTEGSRALVEASCPGFLGGRCRIDYEIAVPDGLAVELSASSGDVDVRGLTTSGLTTSVSSGRTTLVDVRGPVEIVSSSGEVSATGLRGGAVSADVSSGDTELSFSDAPDDVTVSAESGDVTVQLPADGNPYSVRAESSSGRAQVDVPTDSSSTRSVSVRVSSGDVDVVPR
jgi:hypothetical protein